MVLPASRFGKAADTPDTSPFWRQLGMTVWRLDQERNCAENAGSTCRGSEHAYPLRAAAPGVVVGQTGLLGVC